MDDVYEKDNILITKDKNFFYLSEFPEFGGEPLFYRKYSNEKYGLNDIINIGRRVFK